MIYNCTASLVIPLIWKQNRDCIGGYQMAPQVYCNANCLLLPSATDGCNQITANTGCRSDQNISCYVLRRMKTNPTHWS